MNFADFVYDTISLRGEEYGSVSEDDIIEEAAQNIQQALDYWVRLGIVCMKGTWVEEIVLLNGVVLYFNVTDDEGAGSSEHSFAEEEEEESLGDGGSSFCSEASLPEAAVHRSRPSRSSGGEESG